MCLNTRQSWFQEILIDLLKSDDSLVRTEVCSILVRFPNTLTEASCDYLISLLGDKRCMREVCTVLLKFAQMKQFTSEQELHFVGIMDDEERGVYARAILSNISAVHQLHCGTETKFVSSLADENCGNAVCGILARYRWKLCYESELALVEFLNSGKNSEVAKKLLKPYVIQWLLDTRVKNRLHELKMEGCRAAAEVLDEYEKYWPGI